MKRHSKLSRSSLIPISNIRVANIALLSSSLRVFLSGFTIFLMKTMRKNTQEEKINNEKEEEEEEEEEEEKEEESKSKYIIEDRRVF